MNKRPFVIYDEAASNWSPYPDYEPRKPYLRLRQVGRTWSIVRVLPYQQVGSEVVASGLKLTDAKRFIKMSNEEK